MSLAAFLKAAPTPVKKRKGKEEAVPQHRDEENMVKLLAKVSSVSCLVSNAIRRRESVTHYCYRRIMR